MKLLLLFLLLLLPGCHKEPIRREPDKFELYFITKYLHEEMGRALRRD